MALKDAEEKIDKQVSEEINNIEPSLTLDEIKDIKIEEIQKYYDDTFLTKKIIEDKAKLGILGVTIAISLVYSITLNYEKLSIVALILSIIALLYSLMAGYLSLSMLSDKNEVYKLTIKDLLLNDNSKKEALIKNYELNNKKNIIRQNYVYSSYRHLTYALVIFIIAFLSNIYFYKKDKIENSIVKCKIITIDMDIVAKPLGSKQIENDIYNFRVRY